MGIELALNQTIVLHAERDTLAVGAALTDLQPTGLIFLNGELGAGKTTVVRGLLRELGYHGNVKSPTYTLAETYAVNTMDVLHLDLYRVKDPVELEFIGLGDMLADADLVLVEWPTHGDKQLPSPDIVLHLQICAEHRELKLCRPA